MVNSLALFFYPSLHGSDGLQSVWLKFHMLLQDRDTQKTTWIAKFVEEVKNDRMVLPALKQIREICQLFSEVDNFP